MALVFATRRLRRVLESRRAPSGVVLLSRFIACHRRIPNLVRPRLFTDKILHRIMFDRSKRLRVMADKFEVRGYVADQGCAALLPELLHVTTEPSAIPFDLLPDRFVIKPSHGANWVRVVTDKRTLDRDEMIRTCNSWLAQNYYDITREWGYDGITPRILVEELIDDGNGITPHDYKLFTFDGRTEFILVVMGRFAERFHVLMTPDWQAVDVIWPACGARRTDVAPPPHLAEMMHAAQRLGSGVDFARIDFYDTRHKLFFGEMTMTPGCGLDRYDPPSFDERLGKFWRQRRHGA